MMFWRRKEEPLSGSGGPGRPPSVMVCCVDPGESRALAQQLTEERSCQVAALPTDAVEEVISLCQRESPALLVLEAMPDAMERLDDPTKDISGRCELAAQLREELPHCRVYLTCGEEFRRLEPVLQKAVEKDLIQGYCFGGLTGQQLETWLGDASGQIHDQ